MGLLINNRSYIMEIKELFYHYGELINHDASNIRIKNMVLYNAIFDKQMR